MPERSDLIYIYDGSYEGMLCCIFESAEKKEIPLKILLEDEAQISLYPCRAIRTDMSKASRVARGISKKISSEASQLVEVGYYTCHPSKERLILDFVNLGLRYGANVLSMLANDTVCDLQAAVKHLGREAHQLKGFVRFSIHGGVMAAVIEPKNFVLPLLEPHFCDRYANEAFVIYDRTHESALIYKSGQSRIISAEDFVQPEADEEEMHYRSLWKTFYEAIAIEGRYNPRCRMSHMQKRYWKHLTEMDPEIPSRVEGREHHRKLSTEKNVIPDLSERSLHVRAKLE